jgi:hypothetical protein
MTRAGDDAERSDGEERRQWIPPATMQWGHPQPRSGEGDEAMRRSRAHDAASQAALV